MEEYQQTIHLVSSDSLHRRGSRISARGGRQGNDDLIWDGNERFLTYANTDLQLFKMFIAILCLNGIARVLPSQGWAPAPAQPPGSALATESGEVLVQGPLCW